MVLVEVDVTNGLPMFTTVGLPDNIVKESKERVKAAIKNCGYEFPAKRITVNLAPADLRKEGAGFDLPIALGILQATGILEQNIEGRYCFIGELSLDGAVRRVRGLLPMIVSAREEGYTGIVIPEENQVEAQLAPSDIHIVAVANLPQVVEYLLGLAEIRPLERKTLAPSEQFSGNIDYAQIKGQIHAKRALEIAAAGAHNVLMVGSPGSGKTMLAQRFRTIMPQMTVAEALEVTKIYSVTAKTYGSEDILHINRPFRAPHHTISDAGLIGGGTIPQPGEVSLAHNGVLFLDELTEFRKHVLEVLRQPLEDGVVTIARANMAVSFPARFTLLAAMNPCPCGYYGDASNRCNCSETLRQRYTGKLSGPLLERIDIHVNVPAIEYRDLVDPAPGESSGAIRERVENARLTQQKRFCDHPGVFCNGHMNPAQLEEYCQLGHDSHTLLERSVTRLKLSARTYHRSLKVARTIADLAECKDISLSHVAEAVQLCRQAQDY